MTLSKLPVELLQLIATDLSNGPLSRLLQVNSHLYNILLPYLYQRRPTAGYMYELYDWPANFMRAVATGNEQGTRNFLNYGADVNIICGHYFLKKRVPFSPWFCWQTPLSVAASIGNDALVIMLLDHGAEINGVLRENGDHAGESTQPAIVDALLSGHEGTVKLLLERGSDIQGPHIIAGGLVSLAVGTGQLAMLKLLVEFGADMNIPYDGVYPLYKAVCSKELSADIARFLLAHGAEIAPIDDGHGRIMTDVMQRGNIDTARLLLERGLTYPPDELHLALGDGSLDFIRLLVEYGMNPDIESLKRVIRDQRLEVLQLLFEKGFDPNTKDSRGSPILHHAVKQCGFEWPGHGSLRGPRYTRVRRRVLVRDMKVISTQNVSAPCSIEGIQRDDPEEILRYLIHTGADVNATDRQGETPVHLARKCAPAVEQILLGQGATSESEVV